MEHKNSACVGDDKIVKSKKSVLTGHFWDDESEDSNVKVPKIAAHVSGNEQKAAKKELQKEGQQKSGQEQEKRQAHEKPHHPEMNMQRNTGPLTKLKVTKKGAEPGKTLSKHIPSHSDVQSDEASKTDGASVAGNGTCNARKVAGNLTNNTSPTGPVVNRKICPGNNKSSNQTWCTHKQNGPALFERTPDIEASVVTVNGQEGSKFEEGDQNLEQCRPRSKKPVWNRPPQRMSDCKRLGPSIEHRIACLKRKRDLESPSGTSKRSKTDAHKLKLEQQTSQQQMTNMAVSAQS